MQLSDFQSAYSYDPITGYFTRLTSAGGYFKGTLAGKTDSYGYRQITLKGKAYLAHRLAWLYMTGEWPTIEIDHINGRPDDNRFCNLRLSDRTGNVQNIRSSRVTSKTGVLGISPKDGKFQARIGHKNKQYYLGFFDTMEEAHETYVNAKRRLHAFNTI